MANIGYVRVSTIEQNLELQLDAVKAAGCEKIFEEKKSSVKERPEFEACLNYLRPGDTLVVWKLDRLGRQTKKLLELSEWLEENGIGLKILTLGVDTNTPAGKLYFTIMAGLAEMERELTIERTKAGLAAARSRGRVGGRKPIDQSVIDKANMMFEAGMTVKDICNVLPLKPPTFYKYRQKKAEEV